MINKEKITFKYDSKENNILLSTALEHLNPKDYINLLYRLMITAGFSVNEIHKEIIDFLFNTDARLKNQIEYSVEQRVQQIRKNDLEWSQVNDSLSIIEKLGTEIINLKAENSRLKNPDHPNYTEEELSAMSLENEY